jgi:hypothetical protein
MIASSVSGECLFTAEQLQNVLTRCLLNTLRRRLLKPEGAMSASEGRGLPVEIRNTPPGRIGLSIKAEAL